MISKNKRVYDNDNDLFCKDYYNVYSDLKLYWCDRYKNCAECDQMYISGGCDWFENVYYYSYDDKLPRIQYIKEKINAKN